ncbi:hypothetical protein CBR_g45451 [Chara braunii]|uniref:Uncharacterized protein n=1 Tax=Chara braunii TaxID=69332 RepID=A0A388LYJ5_CHABU|nr:hypothetical protein CBR_g45451 [Chara braunii]|eukprot:GBG87394.1 hypothetical protein CBR_g45451 [Chara braunii]
MTHISPFASVLGASPPGVPAVRNASSYGGVFGGPLLSSPLLPRRLDYAATIPPAPVWSYAVAPSCSAGGASLSGDCNDSWRSPAVSHPRVVGTAAGSIVVPPKSPYVAPDSTPPVDDVDSSAAVGGTLSSAGNSIVRVCVRDGCRRRLYAFHDAMAGVDDHRGPISDVIDRLLHWSLSAIRAEFGVGVAGEISSTLPSRVCGRDFTLRYLPDDSGADYGREGSHGSASGGLGESQEGSQNSFPSSCRVSQRSDRGRGKPRSAGRYTQTPIRPQTWWDNWEGVDQCGPRPETDRGSVQEAMALWSEPTAPDVVFLEPLCKLTLVCDKKCKWTWHTTLVTTNVYHSRLQQQLFHAAVTTGLTFTLLDNFCVGLGMCSVHKPTFYKFMRTEAGEAEGWNAKVVRQGIKYCELAIDTVMRRGEPVTLMVDGRYDSARGAQHCTVTTVEYETRLVVGVHTLRPSIEGKASNALEMPAVMQLLRGLMEKGLEIRCVVSDDCVALGPQLRALNIEWQKDCHHKIKNIRKHFQSMLQLKEAKKVSNPHECVSEAHFMQFTKKRLMKALEQRFGHGVLTPAEERMKKSDFVTVVMQKMYPYGWRDEGGDANSLHRDIMLVAAHWAGDHSGCVGGREVLCEKAGGPARLPLYSCTDTVYELVLRVLGKQCSTNITPHYVEFRHTSAVETFQGTIIIYAKKSVHFEKSYCVRLAIAVIPWNNHCWRDPAGYIARIAAELLRQEVCPYGVGSLPRDLFVTGEGDPVEVVDDAASGSDHEVGGENRIFIIGHVEEDVVSACDDFEPTSSSESEGDDIELFNV